VTFGGFTRDIAMIWRSHHALVLPTRMEGMPIALVEAMLSGRVPIATDAGGVPEIVDNDRTGFVGTGLSEAALDEVMERAWARRGEWREIGARAAGAIRELVPPDPCEEFAKTLLAVVESPRRPSSTH
jgi:glycosyltransferase involved in cell wall biosynthesis